MRLLVVIAAGACCTALAMPVQAEPVAPPPAPRVLYAPTAHLQGERSLSAGGVGANFLVDWVAEEPVQEPVIEAVMVGHEGNRSVSFVRSGQSIANIDPEE